ncbi:MAG: single-stranded DNA-binding protein [Oscillospiraceae bacterium]
MNVCVYSGRITKTPTLTKVNGISKVTFTLAVRRTYKNKEGGYDADFVFFIAWRNNAEYLAKYIKKGDYIEVASSTKCVPSQKDNKTFRWQECKDIHFISHPQGQTADSIYEECPDENIPEDISFKFNDNVDELENEVD